MSRTVLGLDTSNYRTSVAVVSEEGRVLLNYRELHKRVTELGYSATEWPTVREAYEAALANSAPDDILFIGGSTFIVADFLESCNS